MTHEQIESAIERLRELGGDGCITNADIIDAVFSGNNFKVRDALIALLEQADPDNHMELPKDASGMPIHVGDKVCDTETGQRMVVRELAVGVICAYVSLTDDGKCINEIGIVNHMPQTLTHRKPTVEDVLREYASIVIGVDDGPELDGMLSECASRIREVMADE